MPGAGGAGWFGVGEAVGLDLQEVLVGGKGGGELVGLGLQGGKLGHEAGEDSEQQEHGGPADMEEVEGEEDDGGKGDQRAELELEPGGGLVLCGGDGMPDYGAAEVGVALDFAVFGVVGLDGLEVEEVLLGGGVDLADAVAEGGGAGAGAAESTALEEHDGSAQGEDKKGHRGRRAAGR